MDCRGLQAETGRKSTGTRDTGGLFQAAVKEKSESAEFTDIGCGIWKRTIMYHNSIIELLNLE